MRKFGQGGSLADVPRTAVVSATDQEELERDDVVFSSRSCVLSSS